MWKKTLGLTGSIIDECGPRMTGTPSCIQAAELIHNELGKHCDSSEKSILQHIQTLFWGFSMFGLLIIVSEPEHLY